MPQLTTERELVCPCCGATLVVDLALGRIVSHGEAPSAARPELSRAEQILAEQAARREALFNQSVQDEKGKSDALSRRFEEALKQAHKEPVRKPLRGFDLD